LLFIARTVRLQKNASTGYSGFASVCRVKFNPISGYRTDDPDIRLISQSNEIEVWLVSLPKTDMYVPYRIVLPTVSGYASATSSLLKSQTDANSTALRFRSLWHKIEDRTHGPSAILKTARSQ
jgi:hypothetical protein